MVATSVVMSQQSISIALDVSSPLDIYVIVGAMTSANGSAVPSRLSRRLGTLDAVVIGLGAMLGAGVFAAIGPAARAAGNGLLIGLLIAAFVAYRNATSSAQLAAIYPESGGTYVYGRERLGPFVGYLAGWAFLVGKLASCSAMALTFGYYASPDLARPLAVGAVLALAAVNYFGVQKTVALTKVIVALVLASLVVVVAASLLGGQADADRTTPLVEDDYDLTGILQAAGLLFFAFAGYARIATLGEEVTDPRTTIPRAIPIAFGVTLLVYGIVAIASIAAIGSQGLAPADAPLTAVVKAGDLSELAPVVRVGATVASLGVLLSLMVGISRTLFSMSATGTCHASSITCTRSTRCPTVPNWRWRLALFWLSCSSTSEARSDSVRSVSSCTTASPTRAHSL